MKKFTEQEWKEFQERVKLASLGEKTFGANHFSIAFNIWIHPDSSVSIQKIPYTKYLAGEVKKNE